MAGGGQQQLQGGGSNSCSGGATGSRAGVVGVGSRRKDGDGSDEDGSCICVDSDGGDGGDSEDHGGSQERGERRLISLSHSLRSSTYFVVPPLGLSCAFSRWGEQWQ